VTTRFPILVSSAGRRGGLVGILRRTLADLGLDGEIVATDMTALSSALQLADRRAVVPPQTDPGFVDATLAVCRAHGVRLVVPTYDGELPLLSAARERFAEIGATVSISAPETVAIGRDKVLTHRWLTEQRFPTVRQARPDEVLAAPDDWPWPLMVKPRTGSAAIGVRRVAQPGELARALDEDVVVQEIAPGREHTVDVLVLRDGRCLGAVPRRRIAVRAGEVEKGVTVRHAGLEALARRVAEALPGAYGVLNLQVFADPAGDQLRVIELNARYGGGFPLAFQAGARYPAWTIEELLGRPSTVTDDWRAGVVMLRYDDAVFVDAADVGLG
jgi:carbamoyl-phosphate synthase large subunit